MYKLIDGKLIPFEGKFIKYEGMIYTNPTNRQLSLVGYKPLTETEVPECDEKHHPVCSYEETDDRIMQVWTIEENPPIEEIPEEEQPIIPEPQDIQENYLPSSIENRITAIESELKTTNNNLETTMQAVDYLFMRDETKNDEQPSKPNV